MEVNLDIEEIERRISLLSYPHQVAVRNMGKHIELATDSKIEPLSELAVSMVLYKLLRK
jgi:hypothetical protein